jgi:hypothetical protein
LRLKKGTEARVNGMIQNPNMFEKLYVASRELAYTRRRKKTKAESTPD